MAAAAMRWLGAGALFLGVAEVTLRLLNPAPRAQVLIEGRDVTLGETGGVVTWTTHEPAIEPRPCAAAPGARRAVVVGSSILRGSGTDGPSVFTERLRQDPAVTATWCVDNLSQPAFTSEQKRVLALAALDEARPPARLYWEVWQNDGGHYVRIGERAINVGAYPLDVEGYPAPLPLPVGLAHGMFEASALWRYGVLALGASDPEAIEPRARWQAILDADLLPVVQRAAEVGVEVVLVVCPSLERSFRDSQAHPHRGFGALWAFAGVHHLRWIRLDEALAEQSVEDVRADTCCHYNAAGHAALAAVFAQDLARPVGPPPVLGP